MSDVIQLVPKTDDPRAGLVEAFKNFIDKHESLPSTVILVGHSDTDEDARTTYSFLLSREAHGENAVIRETDMVGILAAVQHSLLSRGVPT